MDQNRKILFVAGDLDYGGAQMHLVDLVNHLDSHFHPTIFILSNKSALAERIKPGIEIHKAIRRWRFDKEPAEIIAAHVAEREYTYFFAVNMFAFFFLALARKRSRQDFPITVIVHNTQYVSYADLFRGIMFSRSRRPQDTFISVCRTQAEYFSKYYHVPPKQFRTIYNGVDTTRFVVRPPSFDAQDFRKTLRIPPHAKVILQVATLRKEKAQHYSIEALKILHAGEKEKSYLVFVGGGNISLENRLRQLAEKEGIQGYVRFCGMQEDTRPYYWISDLFTLSSFAVETFSISALEAMASGLPCVLTNVGGAREMVTDGMNGFIVPAHDPNALAEGWRKVLNGAVSMRAEDIRHMVEEEFSLDSMVRSYESLVQEA